jgi:hypothetical protein
MDAITMPSITSLLPKLTADYPQFSFKKAALFQWSPTEMTVSYDLFHNHGVALLLHELSHGLLDHTDYTRDIELLSMEREAWVRAKEVANNYNLLIDEEIIEAHLDTYRDWLHARSTCPACGATGHQVKKQVYHCVACQNDWRVNDARLCGLKRYSLKTQKHPV